MTVTGNTSSKTVANVSSIIASSNADNINANATLIQLSLNTVNTCSTLAISNSKQSEGINGQPKLIETNAIVDNELMQMSATSAKHGSSSHKKKSSQGTDPSSAINEELKCPLCPGQSLKESNVTFLRSPSTVSNHISRISSYQFVVTSNPLSCPYCLEVMEKEDDFIAHLTSGHGFLTDKEGRIIDDKCMHCPDLAFDSVLGLTRHRFNVHTRLQCKVCTDSIALDRFHRHCQQKKHRSSSLDRTDENRINAFCSGVKCDFCDEGCGLIESSKGVNIFDALVGHFQTKHKVLKKELFVYDQAWVHPCGACSQVFISKQECQQHRCEVHSMTKSEKERFRCHQCNKIYKQSKSLRMHFNTVHVNSRVQCSKCLLSYDSLKELSYHEARCLKFPSQDAFSCNICDEKFNLKSALRIHKKLEHTQRDSSVKCDICHKESKDKSRLRTHMIVVHSERRFKCQECDAVFATAGNLKYHESTHRSERPFLCEQCPKAFKCASVLKGHIKQVHCNDAVNCPVCDKMIKNPSYLRSHVRSHSTERPFQCSVCAKRFRTSVLLKTHQKSHIEEKTHECNQCQKLFKSNERLQMHKRATHNNQRKHVCDHCSESFKLKHHLTAHMLKHTGERAFKCQVRHNLYSLSI